ncbi:MAG: 6-pyruvoyl tetrahydrobiopterin synthase [Gemmatimonadetes bacterium GWC2_71_9]|nr:MAG: 6-pyruvoyl tetrahydrobiopterin synthase [Gemmatimonadetes bacterium GWC2_71_9]OGT96182.1 MAG: 6-pyruvoyl tetrahydrobiopterin synthase [Gemmatimonadetes bacterium RIFCSPLOWO2_02_FULL_71_11]
MAQVVVTRRTHFNAAHRLHNRSLSDAENARLFGPCANPNYHGHNYNLDVSVAGDVDPRTGYVIDIKTLKDLVATHVLGKLDHRNLNLDVPEFRELNPTAENIVVTCWRWLAPVIPRGRLVKLVLWETERNLVEYTGG